MTCVKLAVLKEKMPDKILIVDDYKEYAGLLEKRLHAEGFQTSAVYDGASALQKAKSEKPQLILMDIMMPGLGGTEAHVQLMNDPATKNIPIIFLTGLRAPHPTKKPSIDGVKVIGKSKDFKDLLIAIRETLGKPTTK